VKTRVRPGFRVCVMRTGSFHEHWRLIFGCTLCPTNRGGVLYGRILGGEGGRMIRRVTKSPIMGCVTRGSLGVPHRPRGVLGGPARSAGHKERVWNCGPLLDLVVRSSVGLTQDKCVSAKGKETEGISVRGDKRENESG